MNCAWPLVAVVALVAGRPFQNPAVPQVVNLGRLESTTVTVSSVNGQREQNNRFYGAPNLVDGGRHVIDGINYTTWLSDRDASHWIRLEFRTPVDIRSIMLELTAIDSLSASGGPQPDPTRSSPNRPQEVALDISHQDADGRERVDKLPSISLNGFRAYYPLKKPLERVVSVTLVFPGPSTVEVSEVEVTGTIGR